MFYDDDDDDDDDDDEVVVVFVVVVMNITWVIYTVIPTHKRWYWRCS